MKRIIAKNNHASIFGMSMDRKHAISTLDGNADTLANHILKCVIYSDTLDCYSHWVDDEISEYISIANDISVKPRNKKLKAADYKRTIFSYFADSRKDASIMLRMFKIRNHETHQYPDFEITSELIDKAYEAFMSIEAEILPIITISNDYDRHDFAKVIHKILDNILETR